MFRSKQDVDRHVNEVFRSIKSEYERNLKCYQIAKLYYKFKDYKSAIKYINRYILTTSNSAAAHRLLGECYLGTNLKLKALDSFKVSLELNGNQDDLVLKICNLLMDPDVLTATPRATYWVERAETLFPSNPIVFQLREHLLKNNLDGKQDNGQLEKLILSEITARPTDVTVRIRLLNLFLSTKRHKLAYQHALEIEEKNTFSNDLRWYDCLCNLVQAYEMANSDPGFSFYIKKIIFFERRADLFMQEFQEDVKTLFDCSSALFTLDQNLQNVSKIEVPADSKAFFTEFMKHMKCQLSFHLATLALKRAKKEYGIWPKAFRAASPLFLQATQITMDLKAEWYSSFIGKFKFEKEVKQLNKSAALRISQAGHVLIAWAQGKNSKFLEKVSQFCGGKWQNHVYRDIFYVREHQQATATSYFINDSFFADVPMKVVTESELAPFDEVSQSAYPDSLHHLVWLGLAYCNSKGQINHDFKCMTVPDLQFTVVNLSQFDATTLNQLDVDAFLYASVLCAKSTKSNITPSDRPSRLPVSISDELCSPAQADWWVCVYKTYTNQSSGNLADMRLKLRKGIEIIRVFGQHGLHVKVIVMLAKLFQERAAKNKNPNELNGLEERAYLYWTAAIPLLEKLEKNQQLREVPNKLFDYKGKDLTQNEIKNYIEDGKLFLACRLMKQGRHEQAIEAFQNLKSPYATFYQGLIYEKFASEEVNHRPEQITSENRSQHIILLTRARDAFYLTLDRLRSPSVESNHPLTSQLQDHLERIENQLANIQPDGVANRNGDSESDETDTAPGQYSPEADENLDASFNVYNASNFAGLKNNASSRTLRQTLSDRHPSTRFEARPSPERLDAQLRHLVQANNNFCQAVVEQLKEINSAMQISLKDLGCVTRDLLAEFKRWNDINSRLEAKKDAIKQDDLFELREEDYDDLSQLSQPYTPYQNYPVNRQMTGTQGTSTVTYGTSVPSPVPHLPPVIPNPENPLIPPSFYPGGHAVPPIDPNLLLFQSLGYYAQGMPGYGENQNVPDYRGTGIQKGAPFAKNAYKAPEPVVSVTAAPAIAPQPPNVVITSSDTLPAFTSAGTPAMSVTIPPQHIRGPASVAQKPNPSQVHPFQIQMPPQAQLVKESPMEKLNSMIPTTSTTGPIQTTTVSGSIPSAVQQTPPKEVSSAKPAAQPFNITDTKLRADPKKSGDDSRLFESRGNLSILEGNDWVDKGQVFVKILHDEKLKKVRIILLEELYFNVLADYFIMPDMTLESLKLRENGWIWTASNLHKSDLQPHEMKTIKPFSQKYRIQFNSMDEAKDFETAFNKGRGTAKEAVKVTPISKEVLQSKKKECKNCKTNFEGNGEKCSSCEAKSKSGDKTNFGGFTFTSSPIVKSPVLKINQEKEKPKETVKPSPFAEFSFSTTPASTTATTTTVTSVSAQPTNTKPLTLFGDSANVGSTGGPSNWFAGVKSDPNAFKKDANFTFEGSSSLVFGYLNKPKTSTPVNNSEKTTPRKSSTNEDDEGGEDEFVPTAEFTPVVDLPDLVDVKTGEENDKLLFEHRAKLLRFETSLKEWKERGVGNIKVLLNEESGKVRLIMRRELVLKVCCNHYLDEKMEFKRMTKSEKALTWYAQDYSEGDLKPELFALKFGNPDSMVKFEKVIKETQAKMKNGRMEGTKVKESKEEKPAELKPLSELFKPKAGSWECGTCLIRNNEESLKCVSCETPKPGSEGASKEPSSQMSSLGKGITFGPPQTTFTFGIPQSSTPSTSAPVFGNAQTTTTGFKFGMPSSTNTTTTTTTTQFLFGIPNTTSTTGTFGKLSFGTSETSNSTSSTTAPSTFQMPTFGANTASTTTFGTGSSAPLFSNLAAPKINFSTSSTTASTVKPSIFGVPKTEAEKVKTEITTPQTSFSFATALKPEGKDKFEFSLPSVKPPVQTTTPSPKGKKGNDASDESDGEVEEDNGDHIIVQPIVPLPDKVALHTGEEDEDVLFEKRAKLFRFCDKEWKERGIGDVKILKHKTTNKIRFLMRRETILKICLNHYLTSEINLLPKDDKTWQWSAADFSEGKVSYDMFAIRFKTPEIANEFKKAVDDAKNNLVPSPPKAEVKDVTKEATGAMKSFTFAVPSTQKPEVPKGSSDDDILVVYENKVTPEQREKAMSLHLPPNFYAYLQAPDCPGCLGCDKEEAPVQTQQTPVPDSTTPKTTTHSILGNTSWGNLNFGKGDNLQGKVLFTFAGNLASNKTDDSVSFSNTKHDEDDEEDEEDDEADLEYDEGEEEEEGVEEEEYEDNGDYDENYEDNEEE